MNRFTADQQAWNRHWRVLTRERKLFGWLASAVRRHLISHAVRHYTNRFFASRGLFVEVGCGGAESSARIERRGRKLVGLDFSLEALGLARTRGIFDGVLCADIRHLPFRDGSLAGLWNLGVMEHFPPEVARQILAELNRVLTMQATALLFWPPAFGLSRWALAPVEWTRGKLSGARFRFFPDEVNRLSSRRAARRVLAASGFEPVRLDFNPRDGFNHLVIVARKAPAGPRW